MIGLELYKQNKVKEFWERGLFLMDEFGSIYRYVCEDCDPRCIERKDIYEYVGVFNWRFPLIWVKYLKNHRVLGDNAYLYYDRRFKAHIEDSRVAATFRKEFELTERAVPKVLYGDTHEDIRDHFGLNDEQARILRIRAERWIDHRLS